MQHAEQYMYTERKVAGKTHGIRMAYVHRTRTHNNKQQPLVVEASVKEQHNLPLLVLQVFPSGRMVLRNVEKLRRRALPSRYKCMPISRATGSNHKHIVGRASPLRK